MTYAIQDNRSFSQLGDSEVPKLELEGVVMGAIIQSYGRNAGIQFSLGPHTEDSWFDGCAYVIVRKQGDFDRKAMSTLDSAKQIGSVVRITGLYTPERRDDCLGTIKAKTIDILPFC